MHRSGAPAPYRGHRAGERERGTALRQLTILGWSWIAYGSAVAALAAAAAGYTLIVLGDGRAAAELAVLALGFVPGVIAGIGLRRRRRWARHVTLVMAALSVLFIPVGTMIAGYTAWVLLMHAPTRDAFVR